MQHIELKVDGMMCNGCSGRLQRVLKATDGVCAANVVLDTRQVTVEYDAGKIGLGAIHEVIADAGFSVALARSPLQLFLNQAR